MAAISLLPFHKSILSAVHSPESSDLLLLARGLGLRRVVCTLMQIYESPQNLVILVNTTPSEESGIGDELSIMGCRKPGLRIVTHEMNSKDRYEVARLRGLHLMQPQTKFISRRGPSICHIPHFSGRHAPRRHPDRSNQWSHRSAC